MHGLFHNTVYDLAPDGEHVSYDAFCMAEEVEKCPTPRRVTASVRSNETLRPGDFYTAPNGTYHSADTDGFAATVAVFSDWTTDPCRIVQNTPLFDPKSGVKGIPDPELVQRYLKEASLLE